MGKILAAAYCRESKSGSQDEHALHNQIEFVTNFIRSKPDLDLYEVYSDLGYTGRNFNRPGWQMLLHVLDKIRCIVVYDLSRLGRNLVECSDVIDMLTQRNIRLITIGECIDTVEITPGLAMQIDLYNFFNAEYLRDISIKTHAALDYLRKQGNLLPAVMPYGYKKVDGKMHVDEEKAQIVRRIFDEYALKNYGFTEIARRLEDDDVLKPGKGKKWYASTVRAVLRNRMYTGEYVAGKQRVDTYQRKNIPEEAWIKIPNHHDAIVSETLFDMVQERLIPRDYVRHIPEPENFGELKDVAYCGHCGSALLNKDGKYYCKKCRINVPELQIHQELLHIALEYQKALPHPEKMDRTKHRIVSKKDRMIEAAKLEVEKAWRACDNLMGQSQRGEITNEEFSEWDRALYQTFSEAETEEWRQEEEREKLERQMHECITFVRKARRLKFTGALGEENNAEDIELMKELIDRAILTKENDGKRITVIVKMADRIKEFYDWWDRFEPEIIMAG